MVSFAVALYCHTLINLNLHFLVIPCVYGFRPWWPWEKCSRDLKFSSIQSLSCIQRFETPWTAAWQGSLSITNYRSLLKHTSIESLMPFNHLILCWPFSTRFESFPASGSFQMSQFFTSGGQSTRVSASAWVLPMNIQDWFPLGWTDWISLQSRRLSRVFSNTTVQKHQLHQLTSIHDYWKNHGFD